MIGRAAVPKHLCGVGVLLTLACSSGSLKGGADTGSDGGGDLNGGALVLPKCVSDLLSACPPVAPCASSLADGGTESICFGLAADGGVGADGGARATVTTVPVYPTGPGSIVIVTKADGSPCYSFESLTPTQYDDMVDTWTWKDATGNVVASGSLSLVAGPVTGEFSRKGVITCAAGGAETSCTIAVGGSPRCCDVYYGAAACPDGLNPSAACSAGSCP